MNSEANEQGKAALMTAHAEYLRHIPDHTSGQCSRCGEVIPCAAAVEHVAVMVGHGHLTSEDERKQAEHGHHGCDDWARPYAY